jgi:hypothetical protein
MIKLFMFKFTRKAVLKVTNIVVPDSETQIVRLIARLNRNVPVISVLDIGGGAGVIWKNETLSGMLREGKIIVTVFDAKIGESSDLTFISGIAPSELSIFGDNSFDVCICCDVIEHLPKFEGYNLLYHIERISSMEGYLFTPNGFVKQAPEPNNPYNAHISSWSINEIRNFGWAHTTGLGGFKFFYSEYGLPKYGSSFKIFHFLLLCFALVSRLIVYKLLRRWAYSFSARYSKRKSKNLVDLGRLGS